MTEEKKKTEQGSPPFQRNPKLNLEQRINLIMAETQKLVKEKFIEQGGGFKVITSDQVAEQVQPLLVKHGVNIHPSVVDWGVVEPDPQINPNTGKRYPYRTEATVRVRWVNIDDPADYSEADWFGFGIDSQDKGPGKAVTYAIRYSIVKRLNMVSGDKEVEDGNEDLPPGRTSRSGKKYADRPPSAGSGKESASGARKANPKKKISEKQEVMLRTMVKDHNIESEVLGEWMAYVGSAKFVDLTNEGLDHLIWKITKGERGKELKK